MTLHISFGILILVLIVLRFFWRITHPVAPESSLPPWQRLTSEAVHWLLYALVFAATVTGWLFTSFRGWPVSFFHLIQLPMLASESASAGRTIEGWHQAAGWALLVVIAVHVLAAMLTFSSIAIALCSEGCPDDPILTSMSVHGTKLPCHRIQKMSAVEG
jgi:cytochrome b561